MSEKRKEGAFFIVLGFLVDVVADIVVQVLENVWDA